MKKELDSEDWLRSYRDDIRDYPIGTKFQSLNGGYWISTELGFKWCTGATFPNVGGDWNGYVSLPKDK